ncbi:hypothetical protein ACE10Z_27530 [Bradyrhizobium sp. Pha-3]|uniref:hypothetical protein n=1 Tax=Bradyrhizobium sp. Pha-3 TaxID=208375 RepID=UPI0035D3E559
MQASTKVTPTAGDCDTIFVAIELSQKTWLVTLHSPDRERMSRHKLEGGDHAGLLVLIERIRAKVAGKLGSAPRVVSCYEATGSMPAAALRGLRFAPAPQGDGSERASS